MPYSVLHQRSTIEIFSHYAIFLPRLNPFGTLRFSFFKSESYTIQMRTRALAFLFLFRERIGSHAQAREATVRSGCSHYYFHSAQASSDASSLVLRITNFQETLYTISKEIMQTNTENQVNPSAMSTLVGAMSSA